MSRTTRQPKHDDDFRPAIACAPALRAAQMALPLALRRRAVARVEIEPADIARLQSLRDQRVVLTPNHPTTTDPALMFELSRRAGMPFNYLCCREAFDAMHGLWGALIQRIGAYSVVRGTIDRDSFRYTRELLSRPAAKLVIFPEGEVYSQNDSLLPFQSGAIQLALWGREEARKTDPNAQIFVLPCALRYRFIGDVRPVLCTKLSALEARLRLSPAQHNNLDIYARMRRVALAVLSAVEAEYHLKPGGSGADDAASDAAADLTPRFEAAKEAALARAASLLGETMPRGTMPERMRALLHAAEQEMHDDHSAEGAPPALARQRADRVRLAWRDLQRLSNWIAVYDGYARQSPDQEHIAEVVHRLETEVCGRASVAGMRVASVRVGEPLPLPEIVSRKELPDLTMKLENQVADLLRRSAA